MKTQGEIEAAICEGVRRFEQEYMGRGPKDIHTHLISDLLDRCAQHGELGEHRGTLGWTLESDEGAAAHE